jgi:hypothetical protein
MTELPPSSCLSAPLLSIYWIEKTRVDRLCGSGAEVTKVKWRFVFKDKKGDVEICASFYCSCCGPPVLIVMDRNCLHFSWNTETINKRLPPLPGFVNMEVIFFSNMCARDVCTPWCHWISINLRAQRYGTW